MFFRKQKQQQQERDAVLLLASLEAKSPLNWTSDEVGVWLNSIGFASYIKSFKKNEISGDVLFSLTNADLKKLGVKLLGHQRSLITKISRLSRPTNDGGFRLNESEEAFSTHDEGSRDGDEGSHGGSRDQRSHSSASSSTVEGNKVELSISVGGQQVTVFCKRTHSLEAMIRKVQDVLDAEVDLFLGAQAVTKAIWKQLTSDYDGEAILLISKPSDLNKLQEQEKRLLHGLADAAVVVNVNGKVLFVNLAFEGLFGYQPEEVVGRNVSILMPEAQAKVHDSYIRRYLETGDARVIGFGRKVQAKTKNGRTPTVWLSLSEQKTISGRHTFMATLHELTEREQTETNTAFVVLDGLQEPVVCINQEGTILFFNSHCEKLLGYNSTSIGDNISKWMPEPYSSNHSAFLKAYVNTGVSKIIGHGPRTVVCLKEDGSSLPTRIEVGECSIANKRYFVGILNMSSSKKRANKTLEERTSQVVDSLSVPAIVIDPFGTIVTINRKAYQLFGWNSLIGENVKILMRPDDANNHSMYLQRFRESRRSTVIGQKRPVVGKHRSGRLLYLDLSLSLSTDSDDPTKYLLTGVFFENANQAIVVEL